VVIVGREIEHTEIPVVPSRSVERNEHRALAPSALLERMVEEPQKAMSDHIELERRTSTGHSREWT